MTKSDSSDHNVGTGGNLVVTLVVLSSLLLAVAFNLVFLFPEVQGGVFFFNDHVMHLLMINTAADAIRHGQDATDVWQRTMSLGFPLFHYYQHLPHISVALIHVLTLGAFPLIDIMRWTTYLLLCLFPLSIYWSLRRFGFGQLTGAMGGLVASLAATNHFELVFGGLDYANYTFRGWGVYTQLWAMALLPPALAMGYRVIREGQGYFWATLFLAATLMSHLMYGYMAFITLGAFTFIQLIGLSDPKLLASTMWRQWKRLVALLLLVVVVTSYFLVPFLMDPQYMNAPDGMRSVFRDSLGHSAVLRSLIKGDLFDFQRFPSLTILIFAGLAICIVRWKQERHLVPIAIFLLGLLLYFGRATWGPLIDLLPMSQHLQMHRFLGLVHLGGFFLAATALATLWNWAISRGKIWYVAAVTVFTLLLLLPVYVERKSYLSGNSTVIQETREALAAEDQELSSLFNKMKGLPPGRVYAGDQSDDRYKVGYSKFFALAYGQGLDIIGGTFHRFSLPGDFVPNFSESNWDQYDLFNVRYVIYSGEREFPAFVKPLQQFGRHHLFEVETTGYFNLVGADLTFAGDESGFDAAVSSWMASELPNAHQHPVVLLNGSTLETRNLLSLSTASKVIPEFEVSTGPTRGAILSEAVGNQSYAAEVKVERESMLMLKATYHPNWHATVDGVKADTVMLMPGFTGVHLAPGTHKVRIEYKPRILRKILLCLGLLALISIPFGEKHGPTVYAWFTTRIPDPRSRRDTRASRRRRRRR